jgi:hypothetical protein
VPRPRNQGAVVKRDSREPAGFAAAIQSPMASQAWSLSAGRRPQLLPDHVAAFACHPATGQLDLRFDSRPTRSSSA